MCVGNLKNQQHGYNSRMWVLRTLPYTKRKHHLSHPTVSIFHFNNPQEHCGFKINKRLLHIFKKSHVNIRAIVCD